MHNPQLIVIVFKKNVVSCCFLSDYSRKLMLQIPKTTTSAAPAGRFYGGFEKR